VLPHPPLDYAVSEGARSEDAPGGTRCHQGYRGSETRGMRTRRPARGVMHPFRGHAVHREREPRRRGHRHFSMSRSSPLLGVPPCTRRFLASMAPAFSGEPVGRPAVLSFPRPGAVGLWAVVTSNSPKGDEFEVHPTRAVTDGAAPLALGRLGRFARPGGNALKGTPAVNVRTCRCPLDACRGAVNGQEV
jgi:hypothetical protein